MVRKFVQILNATFAIPLSNRSGPARRFYAVLKVALKDGVLGIDKC